MATFTGSAGIDTLTGLNGEDNILYGLGDGDTLTGAELNDILWGDRDSNGNDPAGTAHNDILLGLDGNDILYGNVGNDTLDGGNGNDTLDGGTGTDTAAWSTVTSAITLTGNTVTGSTGTDVLTGIETITGTAFGDTFNNTGFYAIDGGAGTDTLSYAASGNAQAGGVKIDLVAGTARGVTTQATSIPLHTVQNIENITGTIYADTLTGNDAANLIITSGGVDFIKAGRGSDTIDGAGGGADYVDMVDALTGITMNMSAADANGWFQAVMGSETDTIRGVVTINSGNFDDVLTGTNVGFNVLMGNGGNDYLDGLGDVDGLFGGSGNDTVLGGAGNDSLWGGLGQDVLDGGANYDVASWDRSPFSIVLTGNAVTDSADGVIEVLTDIEAVTGSNGNDTFNMSTIAYNLAGTFGYDTVNYSGVQNTQGLAANLAGLTINLQTFAVTGNNTGGVSTLGNHTAGGMDNATGTAFDDLIIGRTGNFAADGYTTNTLSGGDGNDTLRGGGGNDTLLGGNGSDTADFSDMTLSVNANLSTVNAGGFSLATMGTETDFLQTIENLRGGSGADSLTGDGNINGLEGGTGNDNLLGLAGNDTLSGDAGNDTLDGGTGADSLTGGTGDDSLWGDFGNDTLWGGDGNDLLQGGYGNDLFYDQAGNDTVYGGSGSDGAGGANYATIPATFVQNAGDDTYIMGDGNDGVTSGEGNDSLDGGTGDDTLVDYSADIASDSLSGGAGNDYLESSNGADLLEGGDGNDQLRTNPYSGLLSVDATVTMRGGAGDDLMSANYGAHSLQYGDEGNDSISGANGDATIASATGSDTLYGGLGNDRIEAYGGADTLFGDEGLDTLDGGTDSDTLFGGVEEDRLTGGLGDDILYGDTLPLSGIPFADVFVETEGDGFDIIRDFQSGYDQLSLSFAYTLQAETYNGISGVMVYESTATPAATTFIENTTLADAQVSIL